MSNKKTHPIFIVSIGNSGACAVLEMLKIMGVHIGDVDEDHENPFVKTHNCYFLNDDKDAYQKYTPYFPFINTGKLRDGLLENIKPPKGKSWAVQDQRFSLTYNEWKKAFPDAKTIIVERGHEEICEESEVMGFEAIEYRQAQIDEIKEEVIDVLVVQYERLIIKEEFRKAFREIVSYCGINPNTPANSKKVDLCVKYMADCKIKII